MGSTSNVINLDGRPGQKYRKGGQSLLPWQCTGIAPGHTIARPAVAAGGSDREAACCCDLRGAGQARLAEWRPHWETHSIWVDIPNNDEPWLTVVGVVADVKARLNSDSPRSLLVTTWPEWVNQMDVVVRTSSDPLLLANAIRREINRLDPSLAAGRIETVNQLIEKSLSAERFRTWLLICFAIAALLLPMLGIAGLLAYNTAQRTHEFGVRIALGADRRALALLVLARCLRLSGSGIAVGLLASIFATRALGSLLYDTSPHDLGTFIAVPSILTLVALVLVASMFPLARGPY
jgi:hypothetical protein